MRYAVFETATGRIDRIIVAPPGVASASDSCRPGEDFVSANDAETDSSHYVQDFALVPFPSRPSDTHCWDWQAKAWREDLAAARRKAIASVELERDSRIVGATVMYDGKLLDADERATANLTKKLMGVSSRISRNDPLPPEQLVWRDANNEMHYFPDMAVYKDWLDGFAIVLDSRGTDAYAWSWQKKARIEAAQSRADLDAISFAD